MYEDIPFITDNGNYILDCELKSKIDPYQLHEFLIHLTGVLETGYFRYDNTSDYWHSRRN